MLTLYNTRTHRKEPFVPRDPSHIGMYVCGPTVYDTAHIGNARPYVAFGLLSAVLKCLYERVTYVRNITDIDDKIMVAAKANGESIRDLTERTTARFHQDMAAVGAHVPTHEPRATDYVSQMQSMIQTLIDRGNAYVAEGHVLFAVASDPNYGSLSGRCLEDMIAGARVEVAPYKKDPCDFVLWKPSTPDMPGWESPWGRGRPGWHIECSAMSAELLGTEFDIHAGGRDLIFPHHENEIAQSTCAHGTELMAQCWLHNGYVTVDGEKMSKSLGNFVTVHQLLKEWPGEVIRYVLLSAHYRQPLDWNLEMAQQAKNTLDRWYGALRKAQGASGEMYAPVWDALCDDLNTPQAFAELHQLVAQIYKTEDLAQLQILGGQLKATANFMGFLQASPEAWFQGAVDASEIEQLIEERLQARRDKNFARADEIRKELLGTGVILEDSPQGTTWRKA